MVDDVAPVPAALPGRALLLQPLYAQREAATDVANVASALSQAGVPFDRPSGEAAWTDALETLASTERYALAVVPGYLMGSAVNGEASEKLRMESQHHARATFAFSTGANEPIPTAALCALAMCPLASHGVMHPLGFKSLPRGTCQETVASYRADRPGDATLCGEVAVSAEQLASLTGRRPRLWTSPYLAPHPDLFSVLVEKGFVFDAGFAVGDLPYNLPLERARILELPIAGEDALETTEGGEPHRPSHARLHFVAAVR